MATFAYVSPEFSNVVLGLRNSATWAYETESFSVRDVWPELAAKMDAMKYNPVRQSAAPSTEQIKSLTSIYWPDGPNDFWSKKTRSVYNLPIVRSNNNPGFREKLQQGTIVVSPYSIGQVTKDIELTKKFPAGKVPYKGTSWSAGYYFAGQLGVSNPPSPRPGWVVEYCSVYLYTGVVDGTFVTEQSPDIQVDELWSPPPVDGSLVLRVAGGNNQSSYDLLTEIAELPQTLGYIRERLESLNGVVLTMSEKRRSIRKLPVPRQVKLLAKLELEFRYALMPIFISIGTLREVLKELSVQYVTTRGRELLPAVAPVVDNSLLVAGQDNLCAHRCYAKSRFDPVSVFSQLRRSLGTNLIPTLWEVTPWSFVFDWVSNFGDNLNVLFANNGATQQVWQYSIRSDNLTWQYAYDNLPGTPRTTITLNAYERHIINPLDHLGLHVSPDLTFLQSLDGLALAVQKIVRDIRS